MLRTIIFLNFLLFITLHDCFAQNISPLFMSELTPLEIQAKTRSDSLCRKAKDAETNKQYLLALNYYLLAIESTAGIEKKSLRFNCYLLQLHYHAIAVTDIISAAYKNIDYNILMTRYVYPLYEGTVSLSYQLYSVIKLPSLINKSIELTEKLRNLILRESVKKTVLNAVTKENPGLANQLTKYSGQILVMRNKIDRESQKNNTNNNHLKMLTDSLSGIQQKNDSIAFLLEQKTIKNLSNINNYKIDIAGIFSEKTNRNLCLIYYFYGDKNLFAFCMNRYAHNFVIIKEDSIPVLTKSLIKALNESDFAGFSLASNSLYNLLIKPFELLFADSKKLIIIPDKHLNYLPFDCLLKNASTSQSDFKNADYLMKHYQIDYYSSLHAYYYSLNNNKLPKNKTIAFFSPFFNPSLKNKYPGKQHKTSDSLYINLTELRFTRNLFKKIKQDFDVAEFSESKANRQAFAAELSTTGILHLASHTVLNDTDIMASFIVFAHKKDESAYLTLSDMYGMNIKKNLLILGSCATGFGEYKKGMGMISVSQAFMFAGCRNLIYTLWPVDDKATSDIFGIFYNRLAKGHTVEVALRDAKLQYLKECSPAEANPLYWAGIVYSGADLTYRHNNNTVRYYVMPIILILLAVSFFALRKKLIQRK